MRAEKLTAALEEKIVTTLRAGNYMEVAAAAAGISKVTLYAWLREGERFPETELGKFKQRVDQAMAEAEVESLEVIARAARDDSRNWTAEAWRLERMHPERYGRRTVITGDPNAPVRVVVERAEDWRAAGALTDGVIDVAAEVPL